MNTAEEKYVVPNARFTEQPEGYELKVYVPGVGKEEAELHLEGRTLTLKTHGHAQPPAGFKLAASEFAFANYAMSVDLPERADPKSLSATLKDGVLKVAVPKRPEEKAQTIQIG